jgi:hypothetical protein
MAGVRRRTGRQGRGRQLFVLVMVCIVTAALTWIALLSSAPTSMDVMPSSAFRSAEEPNSLCNSFLSNIPTYRFYPKRFFEQGAGSSFLSNYIHNRDNFTDIRVLNTRVLAFKPKSHDQYNDTCSIVHYHIHKNGGTTLERHVPLPTDNYYSKREKEMGHEAFEAACTNIMDNVWQRQQLEHQNIIGGKSLIRASTTVRTFTFLRDPVPRFLSSLSQVLKLRVWHKRLYPCYERNTTEALLDCVLDMLETGNIPEMHLAPQSFELYKQVMGHDIFIEVADLSKIGFVMEQLGAGKVPKERSTTGSLIRRFPQFRITMDTLDEVRIRRICSIYAADVKMLDETKVTKTMCSDLGSG